MKNRSDHNTNHDPSPYASETEEWPIIDPASIPCQEISDREVMEKEPLVSVSMSTYNHAPYIGKAIEGVLKQEVRFPIELLIGEDCSTDGTQEIVLEYQKRYPEIIRVFTADINVGGKRNGIRRRSKMRGKYYASCEGDDYWHDPTKLQKQVDILEANPEIGLVHSDADTLNVKTGKRAERSHRANRNEHDDTPEGLFLRILTGKYKVWTCTACTRAELARQIRVENPLEFQTDRFRMGDVTMWMELSRRTRFHYIDEPLATIHALPESASRSQCPARALPFLLSCLDMRIHYVNKFIQDERLRQRALESVSHGDWTILNCAFLADEQVAFDQVLQTIREHRGYLYWGERLLSWGRTGVARRWFVKNCLAMFRVCRATLRTARS